MKIITIQRKSILDTIEKEGIYKAKLINEFDNKHYPYKFLMKEYNYDTAPIFGCLVESNRFSFYGSYKLENEDVLVLELGVPDELVEIQDYYNWTDVIYFNEFPNEMHEGYTIPKYIKEMKISKERFDPKVYNREVQVTIPYIKKEWITNKAVKGDKYITYLMCSDNKNLQSISNLVWNGLIYCMDRLKVKKH